MAAEASEIVVVCAPDGKDWAVFIQHKLSSAQYNIRTCTEDFTEVKIPSLSDFKVKVVLLSPQLLEGTLANAEWDFSLFDKSSSVMILLGLGVMDIRSHLGPKSEYVFQCPHETINEDDPGKSLANALVEIIKVYERDESFDDDLFEDDIYQYPPRPVQINRIDRIIPPSEDSPSKETLILLDRPADGDLTVKLQTGSPKKLTAEFLNKAVYSVKIPDGVEGTVPVKVSCKENVIGEDSIKVQSKLNQLHSLLQDITNPMSLMCQAMGLDSDRNDALDNALANQIKKQWSPQSRQIFQLLDTSSTEEKSSHEWPTLPHFVAEFNLVKTCTELLKFPSTFMVMACCTENCNGEYPCNIAEKKGYHDLAELLIQVVKEHTLDSGVVTDIPPPAPHLKALYYVNQKVEGILDYESEYMDMSGLTKAVPGEMSGERPIPCKRNNPKGYSRMQRSVSDGDKVRISFTNPEYSASSNGEDSQTESGTSKVRPPLRPVSEGSADELSSSPESMTNFSTSTRSPPPPLLPQKKHPLTSPKPKPSPKPDISRSSSYGQTSSSPETISRPQTLPRTLTSSLAPKTSDVQRPRSGETPSREQVTLSDQSLASPQDEFARSQLTDPEGAELGSPAGVDSEDTRHVKNLFGNILARSRSESEPARGHSGYSDDFSMMTEDEEANARLEAEENPGSLIGDSFNPSLRGNKTTRSRISSFLRRLGMKKQISDPGDASRHDKSKKKTVIYGRQGRGSDPGLSGKMSLPAVLEPPDGRDSGSYSEEEEGSTDAEKISYNRKKSSKISTSGNKKSLERKKSVRLSQAMNERISDAPSMPQLSKARARFHSSSSAT